MNSESNVRFPAVVINGVRFTVASIIMLDDSGIGIRVIDFIAFVCEFPFDIWGILSEILDVTNKS